ncbi:MAG: Smr/MutS family protein, partial [Rhodospirillales bacterium]|nr:Smr/MutS family protein [Rhodospirillales bacterium]
EPRALAPPMPAPAPAPPRRPARTALSVGDAPAGLDAASWQRFRSGRLPPARTLDLHGHTAQRAYHALRGFLHAAAADRVRCVEVITGRGTGEAGGVIRREFPLWLNLPDLRPLVLAAAHPHAANPGSVRLLLRRPR